MYSFQVRCSREFQLPNKVILGKSQTLSSKTSLKEVQADLAWFEHDVGNYISLCNPHSTRGLRMELAIFTNGKIVFSKNI